MVIKKSFKAILSKTYQDKIVFIGMISNSGTQNTNVEMVQAHRTQDRLPFCIVWTPIPVLTWLFPFIGHVGIALSSGVIRDFAGPYFVSEDNMAFGRPTKYWRLDPSKARGNVVGWDQAVTEASDIYKGRMHNLLCDNCHSHVCTALNLMNYNNTSWNMVKLAFLMLIHSKFVNFSGFLKTWLPFLIIIILTFFISLISLI